MHEFREFGAALVLRTICWQSIVFSSHDSSRLRSHKCVPQGLHIVSLDLTTESGRAILFRLLQHPRLFSVHFGLPCGTASRARERPVSEELGAQGVPSPPQLRSAEYPLVLPGLSTLNQQKVDSANALYALAIEVLVQIIPRNIVVSIENPWNSCMWSALVALAVEHLDLTCKLYNQLQFVQFHACCHGSYLHLEFLRAFKPSAEMITFMHLGASAGKMGFGSLTLLPRLRIQNC